MTVSLEPLLILIGPLGVSEWITAIMKSRFLFSFFASVLTEGRGKEPQIITNFSLAHFKNRDKLDKHI